jgi:hypothetical protein
MAPGGGWDEAIAKNLEAGLLTTPSIRLDLKALHSVFAKSVMESVPKSFRSSSMVQWV